MPCNISVVLGDWTPGTRAPATPLCDFPDQDSASEFLDSNKLQINFRKLMYLYKGTIQCSFNFKLYLTKEQHHD